jgi:hypothetical protein
LRSRNSICADFSFARFVGFFDLERTSSCDANAILDEDAALIPRTVLGLRKLAGLFGPVTEPQRKAALLAAPSHTPRRASSRRASLLMQFAAPH